MLAELPEIELPEGFHDEVMQKVKAEAGEPRKKSRTIWYIGSFATAAAAVAVVLMLTLPDFGQNQWSYGDFTAVADAAPRATELPQAMIVPAAPAAEPEMAMGGFNYDFDLSLDIVTEAEVPMGRMDMQLWSQSLELEDTMAQPAISAFTFPQHLPTELLDSEISDNFAFTFEIFIAVDDIDYAQEAIRNMGALDDETAFQLILQPAFEDLESAFAALYALGTVEEYRVIASTSAQRHMQRNYEILQEANTIFITLLHDAP